MSSEVKSKVESSNKLWCTPCDSKPFLRLFTLAFLDSQRDGFFNVQSITRPHCQDVYLASVQSHRLISSSDYSHVCSSTHQPELVRFLFSVFSGIWCYSPRMDRAQRLSAIWTVSLSITDLIRPYMFNLQITWCCWADWVPASSRWTLIIWPHWRNLGHYASVLPMFCWSHFLISNTLYRKRWVTLAIAFLCKFIHLRG